MKNVRIEQLVPDMVLAADVVSDVGITILSTGTKLTTSHISSLSNLNIEFVYIANNKELKESDSESLNPEKAYEEAIGVFKKSYMTSRIGAQLDDTSFEKIVVLLAKFFVDSSEVLTIIRRIQCDDLYIYKHAVQVSILAMTIAKWMRLPNQDILEIGMAGFLHDIGKAQIPSNILNKPGQLNIEEFEVIKKHSNHTFESIKELPKVSNKISEAILYHHERLDGTGYPLGLKGSEIPLYSRVIAVADVLDAIMSDRVYRVKVSPYKAIEILRGESFGKLDPKITNIVIKNIADFYVGNKVMLSNGQIGEVILLNKSDLTRPLIKLESSKFLDLSTNFSIEINEVL